VAGVTEFDHMAKIMLESLKRMQKEGLTAQNSQILSCEVCMTKWYLKSARIRISSQFDSIDSYQHNDERQSPRFN
jgi:hypothetical protein